MFLLPHPLSHTAQAEEGRFQSLPRCHRWREKRGAAVAPTFFPQKVLTGRDLTVSSRPVREERGSTHPAPRPGRYSSPTNGPSASRERPSPRLRVGRQPRHPPARRAPRDGGRLCPATARGKRDRAKEALPAGRLLNTSGKSGSLPLAPPRGEWRVLTVRRASSESTGSARMFRSRYGSVKREHYFPRRSGLRVWRDRGTRAAGAGRAAILRRHLGPRCRPGGADRPPGHRTP